MSSFVISTRPHKIPFTQLILMTALAVCPGMAVADALPQAKFHEDGPLETKEGHVTLDWSGASEALIYELQRDRTAAFETPIKLYEGADETSFQSGLPDGGNFFRVRARHADGEDWGPWSPTLEVACGHHSLTLAWTLFACGGVMFVLLALYVGVNAASLDRFETNHD